MTRGPVDGQMADLTYDVYNRLVKVTLKDGSMTEYTYDAESIRTKAVHTTAGGNTWEETYVTDREAAYSQLLIAKRGDEETVYTYGNGLNSATESGEAESGQTESGKTSYYHYNHLGSTTMLTDETGAVTARASYGTYGELLGIYDGSGSDITTTEYSKQGLTGKQKLTLGSGALKFLYNGQYGVQTEENSLYYMRARYYDQDVKRFINRDVVSGELTNTQSLNRYIYVQGNPISAIDPLGLFPLCGMDIRLVSGGNDLLKDLLSFVPVIGNFIDAYDAYQYFKKGDYVNALFSLACAALGPLSKAFKGAKALAKGTKFAQKVDKYTDLLKSATKGGKRFSDIADLMITGAKKLGNGLGNYARKGLDALKSSKPINFLQKNVKNLARNTPQKLKNMANAVGATTAAVMKKGADAFKKHAKDFWNNNGGFVNLDELKNIGKNVEGKGEYLKKTFKDNSLLEKHYEKHGQEIANVLEKTNYSINQYLDDANYIINNGTYVPELHGYVNFMRGKKYGFVGIDRITECITTFHIKNVDELARKAQSLGFGR